MSRRQPWFLVMAPKAAAQRNDFWVGYDGALPCGDVVARLVTPENRRLLATFVAGWVAATLLIWIGGFGSGAFSSAFSIFATVLSAGVVIAGYVRLICVMMVVPPSKRGQSR